MQSEQRRRMFLLNVHKPCASQASTIIVVGPLVITVGLGSQTLEIIVAPAGDATWLFDLWERAGLHHLLSLTRNVEKISHLYYGALD